MGSKIDLKGTRIGRLLIIEEAPSRSSLSGSKKVFWHCTCDCGASVEISSASLLSKKRPTQSCGCKQIEAVVNQGHKNYKGQGVSIVNSAYAKYKWRAASKQISFTLTKSAFKEFILNDCFYCGKPPQSIHRSELNIDNTLINGIDRVDSSIGYDIGNCVSCCGACNLAKSDTSIGEFLNMIKLIYERHIK